MTDVLPQVRERLERACLLGRKRTVQRVHRLFRPGEPRCVVFVGGLQRSGTNMIMDVLDQSDETDVFHESDPRAFDEYCLRPVDRLRHLVQASPASCVVFKALLDLQDVGRHMDSFAPAKALWPVRDYHDMINSHLRRFGGCPAKLQAIVERREGDDWRSRDMSAEMRALIEDRYRPDLDEASCIALFWYFRNALFFEQGFDRDERVFLTRYETLVTEPQAEFARMFRFLGLTYTPRLSRKVTPQSIRKHKPVSLDPDIQALCDDMMGRFDALFRARANGGSGASA